MNAERQGGAARPKYAVGVDAHSKKLAISIWEGSDPWNPTLYREIKSCEIDAMEKTFAPVLHIISMFAAVMVTVPTPLLLTKVYFLASSNASPKYTPANDEPPRLKVITTLAVCPHLNEVLLTDTVNSP